MGINGIGGSERSDPQIHESKWSHSKCPADMGNKTSEKTILDNLKNYSIGRVLNTISSSLSKMMGRGMECEIDSGEIISQKEGLSDTFDIGGNNKKNSEVNTKIKESNFFSFPVLTKIRAFLSQISLLMEGCKFFSSSEKNQNKFDADLNQRLEEIKPMISDKPSSGTFEI